MLPTLEELRHAHTWLTRRYGLSGRRNDFVLAEILAEAHALSRDGGDEVAALFFASARRAKGLMDYWGPLTHQLVHAQLHQRGRRLTKPGIDALRGLKTQVAASELSFDDVADWFSRFTTAASSPPPG